MADYFPLISRAVEGLNPNTREVREQLYARAREALTRQLTSLDPPIPDADLWRERNALEETIRRVEAAQLQAPPPPPPAPLPELPQMTRPEVIKPAPASAPLAEPPPGAALRPPPAGVVGNRPVIPRGPEEGLAAAPPRPRPVPARADAGDDYDLPPQPVIVDPTETPTETPQEGPKRPKVSSERTRAFGGRRLTAVLIALPAMLVLGASAYVLRDDPSIFERRTPAQPVAEAGNGQRKSEGRLDGNAPATPATGPKPAPPPVTVPALPVAARAVFFEETATDPRGVQSDGQVLWNLETLANGDVAVRGAVSVPNARMNLDISFKRNRDKAIPATHLVEIVFKPEGGRDGVTEIGPIEAREQETQPGYQLRGAMVPVGTNLFLVGLSSGGETPDKNLESIRDQRYFAFQFRMTNSRVGAVLIEKGTTGDRIFRQAVEAWSR